MTVESHDYERTQEVTTVPDEPRTVVSTAATDVDERHAVSYDPYEGRRRAAEKLIQAIYLVFGLIEALLAIRFVLRALGANAAAPFAQFIYQITGPLVAPFVGLFGNAQADGSVIESATIVAFIVYALLAWLIAKLVWLIFGETRSAVHTSARSVDTRVR